LNEALLRGREKSGRRRLYETGFAQINRLQFFARDKIRFRRRQPPQNRRTRENYPANLEFAFFFGAYHEITRFLVFF